MYLSKLHILTKPLSASFNVFVQTAPSICLKVFETYLSEYDAMKDEPCNAALKTRKLCAPDYVES